VKAVYALHQDPEAAERSFQNLKALGIPDAEITVMSSYPLGGYAFFERDKKSIVSRVAVLAGILGCAGGVALTSLTQLAWPLNTGGMPIVSIWPNLIVIFELTMLSAILATVVTMFVTSGLPRRLPSLYDREISDGKILIGVANPAPDRLGEIERTLGGNGELRRIE
jgi:hypothetical protein